MKCSICVNQHTDRKSSCWWIIFSLTVNYSAATQQCGGVGVPASHRSRNICLASSAKERAVNTCDHIKAANKTYTPSDLDKVFDEQVPERTDETMIKHTI